jgi:hypothetical protein
MQNIYVGIDVSGEWLDIYLEPIGCLWRYPNNDLGITTLTQKLGEHSIAGIVLEATGGLERICARELRAAGFSVHVVNTSLLRPSPDAYSNTVHEAPPTPSKPHVPPPLTAVGTNLLVVVPSPNCP